MIAVLLPDYKYVRITRRGSVILKTSFWSLQGQKIELLDFCLRILSPLVSKYKFNTEDMTLAYYLGLYNSIKNGYVIKMIDFLYAEFIQFKAKPESISIEAHFEKILKEQANITLVHEESPRLKLVIIQGLQSKTFKLILALLAFATTVTAI